MKSTPVRFQVVTGKKRFGEYLQDAERLFLEIHSNDDDGAEMKVVGYSIIERLNRLIQSNSISEDMVRIHLVNLNKDSSKMYKMSEI